MTHVEPLSELRRQLLERLRKGELQSPGQSPPTLARPASRLISQPSSAEDIPLSCGQQQVWLHSQFAPDAPIYNESITIRKSGPLDPVKLVAAVNQIVKRHSIWRTEFREVSGKIVQVVHADVPLPIPLLDLSHLPFARAEAEAVRIACEDARLPFDLGKPPLLRARLVRLTQTDHRLYLTFHHIVFDGVSVYRVFLPELASLYECHVLGLPASLPDLPIQYGEYAAWQRKKMADGEYAAQLNYWRRTLNPDAPSLALPVNEGVPDKTPWRAGMETLVLPAPLSLAIKQLAAAEGASLYMALLAAFHILLYRYSEQPEITTGAVVSTRNRPELETLIGFLLNTLVLRSHVDPSSSFREFLKQVRNTVLNALANSDVPFDAVVRELAPKRHSSRNALFQVLFSLRPSAAGFPEGWDLTDFDVHCGASGFDLFFDFADRPETLTGRVVYSRASFDQPTIRRMIGHLQSLLASLVANPDHPVGLLPYLTNDERAITLRAGAGPSTVPSEDTIYSLFAATAARFPGRPAVLFGAEQLTFRELDQQATAFSDRLRGAGATPGSLVSISMDRSLEMVIALIGVLKSGAAYLPIDPALPDERRDFIFGDAQPLLQVTSTNLEIVRVRDEPSCVSPGLAYVLYTSGSTGVPKGVEVPQSAVVNFLRSMQREPGFSSTDVLLAITTLSFDIAVLEIFLPLVSGGKLVLAPRATVTDPQLLIQAIRASRCTIMQGTPAVWRALIDAGWEGGPQLKILCGGEALARGLANRLLPRCRELWNMYGPTETTVWSTVQKVENGKDAVSIGRPIDNTQVYVLDRQLQLLPVGIKGELYIGGSGVARGYLGRSTLTGERFLPDPFVPGRRIYRTGDLARRRHDGALEILGRIDHQVKVRGHRVELQEIEEALLQFPGIQAAAVKAWPDASGENSLVAYCVGGVEAHDLRTFLASKLPIYMVPSRFVDLPSLPLTPNGKLDRKLLPNPFQNDLASLAVESAGAGPASDTERRVSAIWAASLNLTNPDIHQDFFNLGGHSLLAATMLRRIDAEFGIKLSISVLFEHPTIAALSALLDPDRPPASDVAAGQQYLHWMYAGAYCRYLASHLRPDYRLHGVSLPHAIETQITARDRLEDVARLIVNEMRANSPVGPYNIGGWCISGILAYEVAVQLTAQGEQLGLVALVGAPNPHHYSSIPRRERVKSKVRHHWAHLKRLDLMGIPRYLMDRARYQLKERIPLQPPGFERILLELALRYEPKPLNAHVALFQGADRPSVVDYSLGWTGLVTGEFAAYDIPGNHVTSLEEPNVQVLAQKMKASLDHRRT